VVFRFELALNPQTDPPIGNPAPVFITIPNANEWTEVEVLFTGLPAGPTAYNQLVIKPDNPDGVTDPVAEGGTYYIDDITLEAAGGGGGSDTPTTAAPAPTQDAMDVTSVFSNAYTNAGGTNPRAFGNDGGAVFSEIQVAGDDVWSYASTNFVGLQNDTGFDSRTNFSMDIWVAEDVSFRAGLISFTDPVSREDVEVNLTGGQWNTIDVAISDLVSSLGSEGPLPDNPTINQIIFDVLGDGVEANIFVDNVFFYTAGAGGCTGGPTMDAAMFPVNFENCEGFNVSFGSLQTRAIVDNPVSGGINTSDKVYEFVKQTGADGFGGFQNIFNTGTFTNNSTITFKIYSTLPNQEIRLEIVAIPNDGGAIGNPAPYVQTLTNANEWVEMSFDLSANAFPNASDETVYTMLVVKPGNVDPGNTPADVTFYVDDFTIATN
jgi:hypothetical protein